MSGYIYILTDGINTKIGITVDFDKRMSSYNTHNPNIQLVKSYPCDIEEARRVETAIKTVFKGNLSSKSKEWFSVSSDWVDKCVSTLLEKPVKNPVLSSGHGVRLTSVADKLQQTILRQVESKNIEERKKQYATQEEMAEHFAHCFSLGIPDHKLHYELIPVKDNASVDKDYCTSPILSSKVRKTVKQNYINFPKDENVWRFFHLVRLATGHSIAICTARVSMPYLEEIKDKDTIQEIADLANEFGWMCTVHHDWSWHYPEKTGLLLFQPKTPVVTILRRWENSFRKWVIERQELLKFERFGDKDCLEKVIGDISFDTTFPLDINSYEELCNKYLEPFFGIEKEDDFFLKDAYKFLIGKWKE